MTVRSTKKTTLSLSSYSNVITESDDWIRPPEWPEITTPLESEQKIVALAAVTDTSSEWLAVLCSGAYTVDWGDGTVDNVDGNTKAEHAYVYSSVFGSPISLGYKIVQVIITPQVGSNLTSVNFNQKHSGAGSLKPQAKWLEIRMSIPQCGNNITLGAYTLNVYYSHLQYVNIASRAITNFSFLFENCAQLKTVDVDATGVTSFYGAFYGCTSLVSLPHFNTSSVTNFELAFYNCVSLRKVPKFNTISATSLSNMFAGCSALLEVPEFYIAANIVSMCSGCKSLKSFKAIVASPVSLEGTFSGCSSLDDLSSLNNKTATGTLFNSFKDCVNLTKLPTLTTTAITSLYTAFSGVGSPILPAYDCANVVSGGLVLSLPSNISRSLLTGIKYAHSYANCLLSASALNEIFTNLGTASGSQVITITGCPGAATCDRTIATAKGWTVTG